MDLVFFAEFEGGGVGLNVANVHTHYVRMYFGCYFLVELLRIVEI